MRNQAHKGVSGLLPYVCRIIYSIFIYFVKPNSFMMIVYTAILIPLVLLEIWALFWFACLLDDQCYYTNVGA